MATSKEFWSSHQPVEDTNSNSNCILINSRNILINNQDCHQDTNNLNNNLNHLNYQPHHNHLHHNHHHYHHGYATPHQHQHHITAANATSNSSRTTNSTDLSASSTSTTDSDDSRTPPPNYHEIPGIVPSYHGRTSGPPPSYDDVVNPNVPPPSYQSLFGQVREARKTSNGVVDLFRQLFLILIGTIGCTMIVGFLLLIPITMILVGVVYINDCKAENIPSFLVIGGFVWIIKNILNCYNQFKKDSSTANRPPPRRPPISPHLSPRRDTQSANVLISVGGDHHQATSAINPNNNNNNNNSPASVQHLNPHATSPTLTATPTTIATTTTTTIAPRATRVSSARELQTNRIRHPTMIGLTSFKCESMLNYFLIVWFLAGCIVVYRMYEPDYDNPLSASYCNRTVYLYAFWLMTSAFIIMAIVLSCLCCLMASSLMSCNPSR